jgi:isocitrate/isopropylmalate dehydrogenase
MIRTKKNRFGSVLAFGMLLDEVDRYDLSRALRLSLLDCMENGHSTRDLGGKLNTDKFTQVVIDNIPAHL